MSDAPKVRPGFRKLASEEERIEAYALARLVGTVAAARTLACHRETVRRVCADIEADDALRGRALARWAQITASLRDRTSATFLRVLARIDATLADPATKLSLAELVAAAEVVGPLALPAAPDDSKGGRQVMAIPAFLVRERPAAPPSASPEPQ